MVKLSSSILVALPTVLLAACGQGGQADDKSPSQVVARVNGSEISVHQVNHQLAGLQAGSREEARGAARRVLEALVEEQLLVQKALDGKLDRDPKVMQAIESSRRQVLAQAYLERVMAAAPRGGDDEVRAYYDANPALFAERRIFRLEELRLPPALDAETREGIEKRLSGDKPLADAAAWLKERKIPFSASASVKTAEQLPLDILPRIKALKEQEPALLAAREGTWVVRVLASQAAPMKLDDARPAIERFLINQHRMKLADAEVKTLRGGAQVEYLGEFAKPAQAADAPVVTPPADARAGGPAPSSEKAFLERGVSGLK